MCDSKNCNPFEGLVDPFGSSPMVDNRPAFNTLAQLGTLDDFNPDLNLNKGTTIQDKKSLFKRSKRKFLQGHLVMGLIQFVESMEKQIKNRCGREGSADLTQTLDRREGSADFQSDMTVVSATQYDTGSLKLYESNKKHFWNMYHCARDLIVDAVDGSVTGKYCKSRLCIVCNSIRQAKLINDYEPVFDSWEAPQFLTLTSQAVTDEGLRARINLMSKVFTKLKDRIRQREKRQLKNLIESGADQDELQRHKDSCFMGVRSLEANFNPKTKTFNPHYHIIIRHKHHALEFKQAWVQELSNMGIYAEPIAQDLRPAKKGSVMEIFKYFTKLATNVPKDKQKEGQPTRAIYIEGVLGVFNAFKNLRAFQSFGFKLSDYEAKEPEPESDPDESPEQAPSLTTGVDTKSGTYRYDFMSGDWFLCFDRKGEGVFTDINLTGHIPSESLIKIAKNIIYET